MNRCLRRVWHLSLAAWLVGSWQAAPAAGLQVSPQLLAQTLSQQPDKPRRYAVGLSLAADERSGRWEPLSDGRLRWRLDLRSPGARNLSLHLRQLQLPEGAELRVSGAQTGNAPWLSARALRGARVLPLVPGEQLLLEVRLPAAAQGDFHILIDRAYHGLREFGGPAAEKSGPFGRSAGSCNIDVACPAADNWRPELRAVVLLSIPADGDLYLCTGTLLNNSAQDDRALILTAHHCDIGSGNVGGTIAYFNVQRTSCASSSNGPTNQYLYATRVLADSSSGDDTDYTLLELASKPPAEFGAYYAGWDTRSSAPLCGATIHQPQGDNKKISFFAGAAASNNVQIGNFRVDAWQLAWARGTTEEGSSGAALWSENHRIVGTLSGGNGACASNSSNNGASDYFARLDRAMAQGRALKQALDPAGTACSAIAGKEAGAASVALCATDSSGSCGASGDTSVTGAANPEPVASAAGGGGSWDFGSLSLLLLALAARLRRSARSAGN